MGWVTPFDPRTHARLPEFKEYKDEIKVIFDNEGKDASIAAVRRMLHRYAVNRKEFPFCVDTIACLHAMWKRETASSKG